MFWCRCCADGAGKPKIPVARIFQKTRALSVTTSSAVVRWQIGQNVKKVNYRLAEVVCKQIGSKAWTHTARTENRTQTSVLVALLKANTKYICSIVPVRINANTQREVKLWKKAGVLRFSTTKK